MLQHFSWFLDYSCSSDHSFDCNSSHIVGHSSIVESSHTTTTGFGRSIGFSHTLDCTGRNSSLVSCSHTVASCSHNIVDGRNFVSHITDYLDSSNSVPDSGHSSKLGYHFHRLHHSCMPHRILQFLMLCYYPATVHQIKSP